MTNYVNYRLVVSRDGKAMSTDIDSRTHKTPYELACKAYNEARKDPTVDYVDLYCQVVHGGGAGVECECTIAAPLPGHITEELFKD